MLLRKLCGIRTLNERVALRLPTEAKTTLIKKAKPRILEYSELARTIIVKCLDCKKFDTCFPKPCIGERIGYLSKCRGTTKAKKR